MKGREADTVRWLRVTEPRNARQPPGWGTRISQIPEYHEALNICNLSGERWV